MSTPAHRIFYSYDQYLALERSSNVKHEYLGGQIYAMAGGTPEHAALAAAVIGVLYAQLRGGPCRSYDADLRVRVPATGLATYPDVTVVCGEPQRDPTDPDAVTNPTMIIEVLSRTTEAYDRTEKFEHYQQLASLQQYVLVAHAERAVEVWTRRDDGQFAATTSGPGERAELSAAQAVLDVDELYDAAGVRAG